MPTPSVIGTRQHLTLQERAEAIRVNLLALEGGRPYVKERLSRFPGESDLAWRGHAALNGISGFIGGDAREIHGRRDRSYDENLCGRVVQKLCQYVFAKPPERDGIDDAFRQDVTRARMGINPFFKRVLSIQQACRWCWVKVDGAEWPVNEDGSRAELSESQRRESGLRPYWSIHNPLQVVDWHFAPEGSLLWLLEEYTAVEDSDPTQEPTSTRYRKLWQPGAVTVFEIKDDGEIGKTESLSNPPPFVPWLPHGDISAGAWWMDGVEARNRAIMNLTSVGDDVAQDQCYGQMVIASDAIKNTMQHGAVSTLTQAAALVLGKAHPIEESAESKGITRYISVSASDLSLIDEKTERKRHDLFEYVGFQLKPDTAQAESASAKAWDHLDVAAVLADNANELEETERKLVAMTKQLDPNFTEYTPEYTKTFDLGDITAEMGALLGLNQLRQPIEGTKVITKAGFELAKRRGLLRIPDDVYEVVTDAIDAMEDADAGFLEPTEDDDDEE